MTARARRALAVAVAIAAAVSLGGCATGMIGSYRGPEPFGGKDYVIEPPAVRLAATTRIVVLTFKDERPANDRDLDWTRQASNAANTVGQPREVRREFDRAIKAGLAEHPRIALVAPEAFAATREADLVISGRILACEADRKMGWSTSNFVGRSLIEVTLRDGRGKPVWPAPLRFSGATTKQGPDAKYLDEARPGFVASAVEGSIARAVEAFVTSPAFVDALRSAGTAPGR